MEVNHQPKSAIMTIAAIVTIVNDRIETEGGLYLGRGPKKSTLRFHIQISELLFRSKCALGDNFLGPVGRDGNIC